jgi:hypothetical protein
MLDPRTPEEVLRDVLKVARSIFDTKREVDFLIQNSVLLARVATRLLGELRPNLILSVS